MRKILLVDDEINVLNALQRALRQQLAIEGLQIETFTNPLAALQRCCECDFDIVISDYRMPELSGVEFLHTLKEIAPGTVRMMLSGEQLSLQTLLEGRLFSDEEIDAEG